MSWIHKTQIYISVSALKCHKGCPKCPKSIPQEIVDCDTDTPGSDICTRSYMRGIFVRLRYDMLPLLNLNNLHQGKDFTMRACDNKANIDKSGMPVCLKDLDTGKCGDVTPEGMFGCICTCSTDLCNSGHRFNPAVGVIMVLIGTTMVMRFLAQIMS